MSNQIVLEDNRFDDRAYFLESLKEKIFDVKKDPEHSSFVKSDVVGQFKSWKSIANGDCKSIVNKTVRDILQETENQNLLYLSSPSIDEMDGDEYILKYANGRLSTGNIMGFIGYGDDRIRIKSRFANDSGKDFFLQYMLSKTLNVNLVNWDWDFEKKDPILDLAVILFPRFLKIAIKKGVFKKYQSYDYNDANVRGVIDVGRHLRNNRPFMGKIAYRTREHSVDNDVVQLIRHTIEYICCSPQWKSLLRADPDVLQAVQKIYAATPTYNPRERVRVLNANIKPVNHPFFQEYAQLQKICKMILLHGKLSYSSKESKEQIFGVIFDGSLLWEDYLACVLKGQFDHFTRKDEPYYLLSNERGNFVKIIPDYISKEKKIIADAKYIRLDAADDYGAERNAAIYYKTVMYMHRFGANTGMLFYPEKTGDAPISYTIADQSRLVKIGLQIPQNAKSYEEFVRQMDEHENTFRNTCENSMKSIRIP